MYIRVNLSVHNLFITQSSQSYNARQHYHTVNYSLFIGGSNFSKIIEGVSRYSCKYRGGGNEGDNIGTLSIEEGGSKLLQTMTIKVVFMVHLGPLY